MQQQRILAIVTIHIFSKKIILKQKYAGGYFLKSTTLRPGGPAGPPGSGKIVGISKTPGIGEKIRAGGRKKIFF